MPGPNDPLDRAVDALINSDELAKSNVKRTDALLKDLGVGQTAREISSSFAGAGTGLILSVVGGIIALVVKLASPLLRLFFRQLTKARQESVPEQLDISAAVLGELLGIEVNTDHIKPGKGHEGTFGVAAGIGGALHEVLTKELAPGGIVTPESGVAAAKKFSGYCINFGVQNALMGTLADALSLHLLEGFKELGEDTAQNLGLGRLHRQAMLPLIRNTVAEPYDQFLRKQYRPDRLSDKQYVNAFHRGAIDEPRLMDELARKGYKDEDIRQLLLELTARLTDSDLARLVRWKVIPMDLAIATLNAAGIPKDTAEKQLQSTLLARADSVMGTYINALETAYIEGFIEEDKFRELLGRTAIYDTGNIAGSDELQWELNYVGLKKDIPRKKLTLAQMESAYIEAIVTLDDFEVWMDGEGYGDRDQLVLEYLLLAKANKAIAKEKLAEEKKARAAARAAAKSTGQPG